MPLSRITLRRGHDDAWLAALSDSLHQALVEAFEVPPADRFQVIDQKAAGERVFDRDYLAGPRSDDWVLFEITGGRPRGPAVKQAFYRRLADLLAVAPGIAAADIMVVITRNQPEDWSFGDGLATLLN